MTLNLLCSAVHTLDTCNDQTHRKDTRSVIFAIDPWFKTISNLKGQRLYAMKCRRKQNPERDSQILTDLLNLCL